MKIEMEIYLDGFKKQINRKVEVNDNMSLKSFCEHVIISLNGNCKHLYQLLLNQEYAYLSNGCKIEDEESEEMMGDKKLSDLELENDDYFLLNYDFASDWDFWINIIDIKKGSYEKDFRVVDGLGVGILENCGGNYFFEDVLKIKLDEDNSRYYNRQFPGIIEFKEDKFDISTINGKIEEGTDKYYNYLQPKSYEINVSLEGFTKEIKRKILVDSNVSLYNFARCVIISMNGDLSHSYGIKRGKDYIDDEILTEQDLNYFELQKGQRLKIIYDWGDSWTFNLRVSKVIDGYGEEKKFKVLSGKGYGIIDDCGGAGRLSEIFEGKDKSWGEYDINEFDLNKTQKKVDMYYE